MFLHFPSLMLQICQNFVSQTKFLGVGLRRILESTREVLRVTTRDKSGVIRRVF